MDTVIWSCFNLQLTNKVHILLDNQSCAHQLSLLRNIQQRELRDRTRQQWVQTNQQWKMTMHHFPRNMILKFKGICLKSDANSNNWCAYAGVYLKQHVYTNVCWTHPFPQHKSTSRSQPLMRNNCQNNLEASTHDIAISTMPFDSMLITTPTTPITLRYEYNWEEPGVLAIKFSYGDLASLLSHLDKPNLAATHIKIYAELEDRSGDRLIVQLPFPRDIRYKSYDELMQLESQHR